MTGVFFKVLFREYMNSEIVVCVSKRVYYRTATNRGIATEKTLGPQVGSQAAEETGTVEGEREGGQGARVDREGECDRGAVAKRETKCEGNDFSLFTPGW